MKLDVSKIVADIDGTPFKDGEHDLKLKQVFAKCLLFSNERKKVSIKEAMDANALAEKIWSAAEEVDVTAKELVTLRDALSESPFSIRVKAIGGESLDAAEAK